MQRRGTIGRWRLITMMLGASLVAAACSGAPAASPGTGTPLASSSAPTDRTTVPTDPPAADRTTVPTDPPAADRTTVPTDPPAAGSTQPIDPSTDVCAPFAAGPQPPATAAETALLGRMPKTVDGEPIRDPKAYQAMQVFCSGPDDGNELVEVIAQTFGLDLRTVVMGRFGATVDSYTSLVEVIHAPGQDGNAILPAFVALRVAFDPASATQASVGGKAVVYIKDGAGKRYQYVDGDTIWTFEVRTDSQAATLIAKLEGSS